MNKGLIGGVVAAVAVAGAIVAAFAVFGGADARGQVDDLVARLGLPPDVTVAYDRANVLGVGGDIEVAGLRLDGGAQDRARAERVVLGGLDGAQWPAAVAAEAVTLESDGATVSIARLTADALDPRSHLPGGGRIERVALAGPETGDVSVAAIELRRLDAASAVPAFADLAVRGLVLTPEHGGGPFGEVLADLGYARLSLDLDYVYDYDAAGQVLRLGSVRVAGAEVGDFRLEAELGGVPEAAVADPAAAMLSAQGATLRAATVTFADASLVDRVVAMAAKEEGLDPEDMRGRLIEAIRIEARQARDPGLRASLGAIERFLAAPGTLRLVAAPPEPVALGELVRLEDDPEALHRALGLRIESE